MLHHVVGFMQAHAAWAAPIAFAFALVKSLALVSLVVPGTMILLAFGGLIGASGIEFVPIWIAVSVGAALGDCVSYALGRYLQGRVGGFWPFSRRPELLPRAERFIRRWGIASVVLCRYFEPLRATVPLLCGVFAMPAGRFQIANWGSAFIWAGLVLGPGSVLVHWLGR